MSKIVAVRYHDFSSGHRVVGHESKCAWLHGHNYRVHFTVQADSLDEVGRVLDFGVINTRLCQWLESHWDHKFLAWDKDPVIHTVCRQLASSDSVSAPRADTNTFFDSIVWVPFNPTAENMGNYLLNMVGPSKLQGTGCTLTKVVVEETRKCSVEVQLDEPRKCRTMHPIRTTSL